MPISSLLTPKTKGNLKPLDYDEQLWPKADFLVKQRHLEELQSDPNGPEVKKELGIYFSKMARVDVFRAFHAAYLYVSNNHYEHSSRLFNGLVNSLASSCYKLSERTSINETREAIYPFVDLLELLEEGDIQKGIKVEKISPKALLDVLSKFYSEYNMPAGEDIIATFKERFSKEKNLATSTFISRTNETRIIVALKEKESFLARIKLFEKITAIPVKDLHSKLSNNREYAKLFSNLSNDILPILKYFASNLENQIPQNKEINLYPLILKVIHTAQYLEIAERHNPTNISSGQKENPISDALYRFCLSASLINLQGLNDSINELKKELINPN